MCTRAAMTARVVIVDVRSWGARLQQRDSSSMLDELRMAWVIAPSHRDQIAGPVSDDGLPPTGISMIPGNHKMADADVIPVARIAFENARCRGGGVGIRGADFGRIVGGFSNALVLTIGLRSGARCLDQLVVKIPAHVGNKTATVGMDAARRKLLGDRG